MNYVGQPVKRFEDPKLITGRGAFVDDIKLPDMLHAAVLRSPYAHARIKSVDAVCSSEPAWRRGRLDRSGYRGRPAGYSHARYDGRARRG